MTDLISTLPRLDLAYLSRCRIPRDLESVTHRSEEAAPRDAGVTRDAVESVWRAVEELYRSGVHPGIQLCIRGRGAVALHRSIGHARGNAPGDAENGLKLPLLPETPVNLFSAGKAMTAMLIHKLDEQGRLHLDDRVCEFIPEFGRHGKEKITLRHLVGHRAGIPNLPPNAMDLDLLSEPGRIVAMLCEMEPRSRPGRILAYHAVSGGFVLAEVVSRVTGSSIRDLMAKEVREPLGLEWMHYGVDPEDVPLVALNANTGAPLLPPISTLLRGALGAELDEVVEMSNDPRFLSGIIPSGCLISTAGDTAAFYQCLLNEGELDGVRIFEPRTVHHAVDEETALEIDLTLGIPINYSLGFMLGNEYLSLYGWNHPEAFGHLGLSNIFCWADPERELVVSLLTTGKPVLSLHAVRLSQLMTAIHDAFPVRRIRR